MTQVSAFHEVRFPLDIALGSTGGPERRTDIVRLASGYEERNARWADSRRRYNAGYGVKSLADLDTVLHFFEERRGRLYGFRWRDRADHKSCAPDARPGAFDQVIGTGDASTKVFALRKTYGGPHAPYARIITKPVAGTVMVAVNNTVLNARQYSCDAATGLVTFITSAIPNIGARITAGFAFDVPVRFDTDRIEVNLAAFEAGDIPAIPLVEIRV